jgi:potassium inwardly-rectifying channel subfamily J protein 9
MGVFNRASYSASHGAISARQLVISDDETEINKNNQGTPPSSSSSTSPLKRLVVRDLPFHQSSNSLRVRHQMSKEYSKKAKGRHSAGGLGFFHWYIEDWFHVLLRLRTVVSVSAFTVVWTAFLLIFAGVYVMVDRINPDEACGLGEPGFPIKFYGAFAFSLETTTTVGYGLPNGV